MADFIRPVTRVDINAAVPAALYTWSALDLDDSGIPIECVDYVDRTVTITGTFGAAGSVTLQGSNDGTNWFPLTDMQANAITKTAASMEMVIEAPVYIRPLVTAGDGTTNLVVKLFCRRTR